MVLGKRGVKLDIHCGLGAVRNVSQVGGRFFAEPCIQLQDHPFPARNCPQRKGGISVKTVTKRLAETETIFIRKKPSGTKQGPKPPNVARVGEQTHTPTPKPVPATPWSEQRLAWHIYLYDSVGQITIQNLTCVMVLGGDFKYMSIFGTYFGKTTISKTCLFLAHESVCHN